MVRAYVGLGANLGDSVQAVGGAFDALAALPQTTLAARSPLYRSAPVDAGGPDFVNAVAALDTALAAEPLLAALHAIEAAGGRQRPFRNAPRTLDLDLLLWGDRVCDTPTLTLPHPRGHLRAFVLRPLADIAPGLVWPGQGLLTVLLARLDDQAVERWRPG